MSKKPGWRELPRGAVSTKSSRDYKTGDWGIEKPKFNHGKCSKCTLCHFFCPEGAVKFNEEGYPVVDESHCKGCGICAKECPVKCIEMVRSK